jgi:Tol biopolymer transport system component
LAVTTLGLVAIGGPAEATFPGSNGRIAFITVDQGCCEIATMEPDGSDVRQLTHFGPSSGAFDPAWSPDGTHLAFVLQHVEGNFTTQLWVMDADGGNQHKVRSDPFFQDFLPSWSPDGTKIVFARCRPDFESCAIFRIRADGSGLTELTSMARPFAFDFGPKYSPDGASIVFESHGRKGVTGAAYVMDADGSNVRKLTPTKLGGWAPEWSPDGSRIVFTDHCCDGQPSSIWMMNLDGSGLVRLTAPGPRSDFSPSFSPAGDQITFERDAADFSKFAVWVMNADGTGLTKISGNADGEPRWGPAA